MKTRYKSKKRGLIMKKLFYKTKIFGYKTEQEAQKHIKKMIEHGWHIKQDFHKNGVDLFPYSIEYYKNL